MKASRRLIAGAALLLMLLAVGLLLSGRRPSVANPESIVTAPLAQPVGAPVKPASSTPAAVPSSPAPVQNASVPAPPFNAWAEKYLAAPSAQDRAALLEEGRKLASERRQDMLRLIKSDPEKALAAALPYRLRKDLPPEIAGLMEQPIKGRGQFKVIYSSPIPGREREVPPTEYQVTLDNVTYRASTYGARLTQPSQDGTYLHGVALEDVRQLSVPVQTADGHMVDSAVEKYLALSADAGRFVGSDETKDLLAAGQIKADAICGVTGKSAAARGNQAVIEFGGHYYSFCQFSHAVQFNDRLNAMHQHLWASGGFVPASANANNLPPGGQSTTQGRKKLLYMPVLYADDPRPPQTQDGAQATAKANNQYYKDGSYGTVDWETTITPTLRLPQKANYYGEFLGFIRADARAVAATFGYFYQDYDQDYVLFNALPQVKFGGRSDGLLAASPGAISHELGHNFGLPHANYWDSSGRLPGPVQPTNGPPLPIDPDSLNGHYDANAPFILGLDNDAPSMEYGNPFDVMGSGSGHFSAYFKNLMNWLPDPFVKTVTASTTNRIYAFDTPHITDGRLYAMRFNKDYAHDYWASYRQGFPQNPWLSDGIEIDWNFNGNNVLLDTTPESSYDKQDAALIIGRTFSDPAADFYLTPVARGGGPDASDKWIDVVAQVGPFPGNQTPTMTLSASALTVTNGATVTFTASAQDPDGDPVAYSWDFGDLTFGINTPIISKTFTTNGQFVVRCEVTDMKGGVASAFVVVTVGVPTTFTISGRVLDIYGQPVQGVRVHNSGDRPTNAPPVPDGIQTNSASVQLGTYRYGFTDSQGYYTIGNIPPGVYTNRAFIFGYRTDPLDFVDPVALTNGNAYNLNFIAAPITRVRVARTADALEAVPGSGAFTVSRVGDLSEDLPVRYILNGSAVPGTDYNWPAGNLTTNVIITTNMGMVMTNFITTNIPIGEIVIPAGLASVDLIIDPLDNGFGDGSKTVLLTVLLETNQFRVTTVATNILTTNGTVVITNTMFIQVTNQFRIPGWEVRSAGPNSIPTWFQTDPTYVRDTAEVSLSIIDDETPDLPLVAVLTIDSDAEETRGDSATVAFVRVAAPLDQELVVHYTVSGVASNGVDFVRLPGSTTIPAGEFFVFVPVVAINDLFVEGNETAAVTVADDAAYAVFPGFETASIVVVDDDLPLVTVYAADSTANNGGGTARVTVSRAGDLTEDLLVNYLVTGSAVGGQDFVTLPGSVTIPAGSITADITITPLSDPSSILPRTVTILISDSPSYNIYNNNTATVTIIDSALPVVSLVVSNGTAQEGGQQGIFTFSRTGPTTNGLQVYFEVGGSAWEGADYAAVGTNVLIPVGAAAVNVNITAIDDSFRELGDVSGNDTVIFHLLPGTNYTASGTDRGTVTIEDNDPMDLPAVGFMLRNSVVREDEMSVSMPVKISANPETNKPVQIEYRITSGSALPNVNYTPIPGVTGLLNFTHFTPPPGGGFVMIEDGIQLISVPILNDNLASGNKTFVVTLFNPSRYQTNTSLATNTMTMQVFTNVLITPIPTNAYLGDSRTHTVTIIDVGVQTVTITATTQRAFEAGPQAGEFLITRTGPTNAPLTVAFAVSGTAASGNDFAALGINGSLTIPAGTNRARLNLPPLDDPTEEVAESVKVTLLPRPGYRVGNPGSATMLLISDDGTLQFTSAGFEVLENAGPALVTVQRTGATNLAATVDYQILSGTATNGSDYLGTNGTLTFAPGEVLKGITIDIINDNIVEPAETVSLVLTNPTGGIPLGGQRNATLTILNDDTSFAFTTNLFRANENSGTASLVIERLGLTNASATVDFNTTNGAAQAGSDFIDTRVTVTFAPGQTNAIVPVTLLDDTAFEGDQTVNLVLSNPSANTSLGTLSNSVLLIVDDECSLEFASDNFDVNEYAGQAVVTVHRAGGTVNTVTVGYATRRGTATNNLDYVNVAGTLTFAGDAFVLNTNGTGELLFQPGESDRTILVPILDDVLGEGNETFSISISNAVGPIVGATRLGTITNATVTILDNETPGNVDYEYNAGGGVNARVRSVAVQPDQRVVFGGDFTLVNGISFNRVARFTTTGLLDPSFNPGAGVNGAVQVVAVQPDSRILIGGTFSTVDGTNRTRLARLTADGNLDLAFNPANGPNDTVRAIAVQSDGKVVIGGDFTTVNGAARAHLARLNSNGSLDTGFNVSINGAVNALAIQSDGSILAGGAFTTAGGSNRVAIVRISSGGAVDGAFNAAVGAGAVVNGVAVQTDGKSLLAGTFTTVGGIGRKNVARLNTDGTLDTTFDPGLGPNAGVSSIAVHSKGRIVLGGDFTVYGSAARNRFARLKADGSLDTAFNIGTGANNTVRTAAIQTDTSVVIGGDFTIVNGITRNYIARIHGDEKANVSSVEFASGIFTVNENAGPAVITVLRTGATNQAITLRYMTTNGTATAGLDYTGVTNTLAFAPGQLSNTFTIPITDDALVEGEETVRLSLTNVTAGVDLSGQVTALLTILDNEKLVQFSATNFNAREDSTNAVVSLTRTGGLSGTLTVTLTTSNGTALAGSDYTATSIPVSFVSGQATATALIPLVDDFTGESAEKFYVNLTSPVGGVLGTPTTASVTILDNDINYGTSTSSNTNAIVIFDGGVAGPYPSVINVSNLTGVATKVVVTLAGIRHTFPSDIDVLLVGPQGQKLLLMSDAGGGGDVFGITLRFDDAAATFLSDSGQLVTSTNRPTDYPPADTFPAPAPAGPYATELAVFNGTDPNGAWSLYVVDDRGSDSGVISNGWRLAVTTVDPATASDLAVTMTDSPDPISAGGTLTYSVSVANNGPLDVTGVFQTNAVPANAEFITASSTQGGCSNVNGVVICGLGDLAVNASASVTISVRPLVAGALTNVAVAGASEPDVITTNNTASAVTTVTPGVTADLIVTLTDSPDPVSAGSVVTYHFTVTNRGPLAATGVLITNRLPANGAYLSATISQGTLLNLGDILVLNAGTLVAGGGLAGDILVTARQAGTLTNTMVARANEPDFSPSNTVTELTTVNPASDLVVVMTDSRDPVGVGANVVYTVIVYNNGPSDAQHVTLFDTLPLQFTLVSATASQGSASDAGGMIIFDFGTITNGSSAQGTVIAKAGLAGIYTNIATAVSQQSERSPADNTAVESTTVSSGGALSAEGIIDNGVIQLGVYPAGHLNVPGGKASLSGTTFVGLRYLPTGAESTAPGCLCEGWGVADAVSGISGGANESSDSGPFGLEVESFVADGVTATSVVRVQGPGSPRRTGALTNNVAPTFRVTHFYHPSPATPNLYQVDVTIENISPNVTQVLYRRVMDWDIEPTPFNEYSTVIKGDSTNLVYTSDDGFASADPLTGPSQILDTGTFIDSGPTDHGALFDFNFGALAPGASKSFVTYYGAAGTERDALTAVARVGAEAFSLGEATTPGGKTNGTPNTFIFGFGGIGGSALAGADLRLTMSTPNPIVSLGSVLTYTVRLTNTGPDVATNVVVLDTLPPSVNIFNITASAGAVSTAGNLVSLNVGSLSAGGQVTLSIAVIPTEEGSLTNSAVVTTDQIDFNEGNNAASVVVTAVSAGTFANPSPINLYDAAPALAYPSVIHISNAPTRLTTVAVLLTEVTHSYPADLDILLVGPAGQSVVLMSDAGLGYDMNAVSLRLDDAASDSLPAAAPILSGTYKPTNIGAGDTFYSPAPAGPYGSVLGVFSGTNPNGDWSLYIVDDQGSDIGVIAGGWRLSFTFEVTEVTLSIELAGSDVVLSWDGNATGYTLESTPSLAGSPAWTSVPGAPALVGGRFVKTVNASAGAQFFRLRNP